MEAEIRDLVGEEKQIVTRSRHVIGTAITLVISLKTQTGNKIITIITIQLMLQSALLNAKSFPYPKCTVHCELFKYFILNASFLAPFYIKQICNNISGKLTVLKWICAIYLKTFTFKSEMSFLSNSYLDLILMAFEIVALRMTR